MARTSRKPAVVSRPVTAPVRVMIAFKPTVQPCSTSSTSLSGIPVAKTPRMNPIDWSSGVVGVLTTWTTSPVRASTTTQSVKVPPMSTPMRYVELGTI
jgi:hypothetical protein